MSSNLTIKEVKAMRERRMLWPTTYGANAKNIFEFPTLDYGLRDFVLDWIAVHTEGKFYLGSKILYFENDRDAMAYKLYDVRNKYETFQKLKKQS